MSKRLLRLLVLSAVAGVVLGISAVASAQEAPIAEEAEAVVDEEGTRPLPADEARPLPEPVVGPDEPVSDTVIAPSPDIEPAQAPTDERVISPGGETIGVEESEGFAWDLAAAIAAGIVAAGIVGIAMMRSTRVRRREPLPH